MANRDLLRLTAHEIELLRKLGDLADRSGEIDQARQYYKQALDLTQALAETGSFKAPTQAVTGETHQ